MNRDTLTIANLFALVRLAQEKKPVRPATAKTKPGTPSDYIPGATYGFDNPR